MFSNKISREILKSLDQSVWLWNIKMKGFVILHEFHHYICSVIILPGKKRKAWLTKSCKQNQNKRFTAKENFKTNVLKLKKNLKTYTKMKTVFKNNNGLLIMENMESYLRQKMPDCCLYSDDGYKFMIHKVNISAFTSYQRIIDLIIIPHKSLI